MPARLRYTALPKGKQKKKFEALAELSLGGSNWEKGASGWRGPFLPEESGAWATFPSLIEFFAWSSPGVKTHRTWIIAPDVQTLERRWEVLQQEKDLAKKETLFHPDPGEGNTRVR